MLRLRDSRRTSLSAPQQHRNPQPESIARNRYYTLLRVPSTDRQGRSGLGLEAQRKAVEDFLNGGRWDLIAEFVEIESGKRDDRPKLAEALSLCRLHNATLVIAKLDRLSRDAAFLLGLQKAGVRFVAADMPEANELVVGIMAVVAQAERKMISARTKAALAAAKARGMRLGKPENLRNQDGGRVQGRVRRTVIAGERAVDLRPIIADVQAQGTSPLRQIAAGLNQRGIPTARGGAWSAVQVKRVLERA
jgi:DNA invertase Pin-like site-specific DNA recombinase